MPAHGFLDRASRADAAAGLIHRLRPASAGGAQGFDAMRTAVFVVGENRGLKLF